MKIKVITTPHTQNCLTLKLDKPVTILWNRGGIWSQIPAERVQNELAFRAERKKAGFDCPADFVFYLFDTLSLTPGQAETLLASASPDSTEQTQ